MPLTLTSNAVQHGGEISRTYTCDGEDRSPPIAWSGVPAGTQSLVLVVDNPDAPDPARPRRTWVHWLVYNIPPDVVRIEEGAGGGNGHLPQGAKEGVNDWHRSGYSGPCPAIGRHRYVHKLYALDTALPDLHLPTKAKLEQLMRGHILAETHMTGTYQRD